NRQPARRASDDGEDGFPLSILQPLPAPSGWEARRTSLFLQRFQILDNGHAFFFGELVAEGMSTVAAAGLCCVVDLAPFRPGCLGVGPALQNGDLPAELDRIIIALAGAV